MDGFAFRKRFGHQLSLFRKEPDPMNEKLEKLNRQKTAAEKKLIAAQRGYEEKSVNRILL